MTQAAGAERETYDPSFFAELAAAEDRHFWFRARNRVLAATVARLLAGRPDGRVLEVGCGTGNVLRALAADRPGALTVGLDLHPAGLRFARARTGAPLVCADVRRIPFRAPFDLVGLFDVLEHLPDDRGTLRALAGLVAPGGALVVTVPAHPSLWSYFDEASRHCRRYRRAELAEKLAGAGFAVELCTEYMMSLYPLVWAGRRLAARVGGADARERARRELTVAPGVNGLLAWVLGLEARWLAGGRRLPFGTSLLAVARRALTPPDGPGTRTPVRS